MVVGEPTSDADFARRPVHRYDGVRHEYLGRTPDEAAGRTVGHIDSVRPGAALSAARVAQFASARRGCAKAVPAIPPRDTEVRLAVDEALRRGPHPAE